MLIKSFLITVLIAFVAGIIFLAALKKFASRYKILTIQGIPLTGGLSIALSFMLASLAGFYIYGALTKALIGILTASFVMLIFGLIDDWVELSVTAKFLVQLFAVSLLILFGVKTQIVYIGSFLNIVITAVWVLAITNALNHLDVMDGVAGITAVIVSLAFFILSIITNDAGVAIMSLALAAAAFSFSIYNFPPAKVYMGNSGSHFLGFVLAAMAMAISYAPMERKMALFSPLLVLGFPIFDTVFLVLVRIKQRRSIFKKSDDHLALRFLKLGYSKPKTLMFMSLLGMFFCLCGIAVSRLSNFLGALIVAAAVSVSLAVIFKMGKVCQND